MTFLHISRDGLVHLDSDGSFLDTPAERDERDATLAGKWDAVTFPCFGEVVEDARHASHEAGLTHEALTHLRNLAR